MFASKGRVECRSSQILQQLTDLLFGIVRSTTNHLQSASGCHYTLDAIIHILEKGMRPGTSKKGTTYRFSAVPRGYSPSGAHALEEAVRYAYLFDYQHEATTLLPNSDFLSLPDHVTQYGPVRAQTLGLYIPDSIKEWLLSGAPRIYDRKALSFQETARLLSRPSLRATSAANSRSNNSRPSLSPSKLKMTRNWMSLPRRAVEWSAPNKPWLVFCTLPLPVPSRVPRSLLPLWAILHHLPRAYRMPAVVVLLLQTAYVLLACILAHHRLSHPLPQRLRLPHLPLFAQLMPAWSRDRWKVTLLLRSS